MQNNYSQSKKICISALFLAMSIIIGRFKIVIPGLFRIIFNGPFYKFIAIIFGPIYGTIISALAEIIGVLLGSVGNYIWLFSVTAALRGFFISVLWQYLYKKSHNTKKIYWDLIYAIAIPDLLVSFLNTLIMKSYFLWPKETFFLKLAARLSKELILILINIFILYNMLYIYINHNKKNK